MFGFESIFEESAKDFLEEFFGMFQDNSLEDSEFDRVSDDDFEDPLGEPRETKIPLPDAESAGAILEGVAKRFVIVDYKLVVIGGVTYLIIRYLRKKGVKYSEKGDYAY